MSAPWALSLNGWIDAFMCRIELGSLAWELEDQTF